MKFIKPTVLTDAMLVSSTATETESAYSAATTYALGAKATSGHRIYQSVQAGNLNHAVTDTAWWVDIAPTNKWAMFDQAVGTITSGATPQAVTIDTGFCNSLALLDLSGTSVTVSVKDGPAGATVYSQVFTLGDTAEILDWYQYFFDPIVPQTTLIVEDLPPYPSARLTVSIAAATTSSVGTMQFGTMVDMGRTLHGAGVSIIDFSKKEVDIYGVTSVLERAYSKRIEANTVLENKYIDYITTQLSAVRATPCPWIGDNNAGYDSLIAFGFAKDWRINIAYPYHSETSITIEGLT